MDKGEHQERVKAELVSVGVTGYGLSKMSTRYLISIIHDDEHVKGAVYGRCANGLAMLVATDKRVLYVERKPLFSSTDEITYDVVSGVHLSHAFATTIELHSRMGNYTLSYVNHNCAKIFVEFIEKQIETSRTSNQSHVEFEEPDTDLPPIKEHTFNDNEKTFLSEHHVAVISTTERTGEIHGTTIFYLFGSDENIYFITKTGTRKSKAIMANENVALTIFDENELETMQLQGVANVETNQEAKQLVFNLLVKPRSIKGKTIMPPVAQLNEGEFVVFKISPTTVNLRSYKK